MVKRLSIFAMTRKGYFTVKTIVDKYPDLIKSVVSARDPCINDDYYDKIKKLCYNHKIDFYNWKQKIIYSSDYYIAISWKWLIKIDETKLIVFHDSLLPKYRGFNPLVTALINGDTTIGVSALMGSKEYDCGDIIFQSEIAISYPIKINDAIEKILDCYGFLALNICHIIAENQHMPRIKQDTTKVSYSLWRDEDDYRINWDNSAEYIKRHIDSVGYPYKGASTLVNGEMARILEAEVIPDVKIENRRVGKVLMIKNNYPIIVCRTGLLKITNIVDANIKKTLLPLSKFRMRFQ